MLSSPTVTSKRWRGPTRGGLTSVAVPGAGMLTSVDPNWFPAHVVGKATVGVGCAPPQNIPAWNSWSAVSPLRSTSPPSETGTAPATNPLSYRQLKPNHGPFFHGWYCKWVVWLNFSSWSIRNGVISLPVVVPGGTAPAPPSCGLKNRAATLEKTKRAENPWMFGTLMRPATPGILELCHSIGKVSGVLPNTPKS